MVRKWLPAIREEQGMTQREVAEQVGISESYYHYIEAGSRQKKMDLALAAKLSVVFSVPIEWILAEERKEEKSAVH